MTIQLCTEKIKVLTLNAPIATKVVCFSRLLKCLRPLYDKAVWTQIRLLLCSRSTLFTSILNLSVMLGSYLQQATSADHIFRCALRVNMKAVAKIASENVVCSHCLLHIFANIIEKCKFRCKQCGPRSDCS